MERLVSYGFLAPPIVLITLILVGALIALRWRRAGIGLVLASAVLLFAASTAAVSSLLLHWIEMPPPAAADLAAAQAIVVLGGEVRIGNGRDVPDTLGPLSLERVVLGARAYRRLHLPVAVSGGRVAGAHKTAAALMKTALETDFAVPVAWTEDRSRTTWENARYTARLLAPTGVTTVVLVTHAWHLPRSIWAFERAGLTALPWPAPRTAPRLDRPENFLPSAGALRDTFHALHEMVGGAYYRLRH